MAEPCLGELGAIGMAYAPWSREAKEQISSTESYQCAVNRVRLISQVWLGP